MFDYIHTFSSNCLLLLTLHNMHCVIVIMNNTIYTATVHTAIADVPLSEFAGYVKELHRDADRGFSQQYSALQTHSDSALPCKAAELNANEVKNRYPNILPCKSYLYRCSSTPLCSFSYTCIIVYSVEF